jgi:hypothetical protein
MARSQKHAKQFFARRVIRQAESEGIPLSDAERQMSDDEYESKIRGLLRRALQADVAADPHTRKRWNDAFTMLERGDHYISVMIGQAVGRKLRPWWKSRWLRAIPAALIVVALFSEAH